MRVQERDSCLGERAGPRDQFISCHLDGFFFLSLHQLPCLELVAQSIYTNEKNVPLLDLFGGVMQARGERDSNGDHA